MKPIPIAFVLLASVLLFGCKSKPPQTRIDFDALERELEAKAAEEKARHEMEETIYSACDREFGAQYRAEAIRLADELVATGEVPAPRTVPQGLALMRWCYAEVAARDPLRQELLRQQEEIEALRKRLEELDPAPSVPTPPPTRSAPDRLSLL
jgi:hypothetical protein